MIVFFFFFTYLRLCVVVPRLRRVVHNVVYRRLTFSRCVLNNRGVASPAPHSPQITATVEKRSMTAGGGGHRMVAANKEQITKHKLYRQYYTYNIRFITNVTYYCTLNFEGCEQFSNFYCGGALRKYQSVTSAL